MILISEIQMLDHNVQVLLLCIALAILTISFGIVVSGKKALIYCLSISFSFLAFGIVYSACGQAYVPFCVQNY